MKLELKDKDFLRLRGARGAAIDVLEGRVWVTEEGRAADHFVGAGRSYRVHGDGLVLVCADTPASAVSVRRG